MKFWSHNLKYSQWEENGEAGSKPGIFAGREAV